MYEPRLYREDMNRDRFRFFQSMLQESDLLIGVPAESFNKNMVEVAESELIRLHNIVREHILKDPSFLTSLEPLSYPVLEQFTERSERLPDEINTMIKCSNNSGTGPMSSVAGIFAEKVAFRLIREFQLDEIVVENGGDLFIKNQSELISVIHAGDSPLSEKMAFILEPGKWGVCTSSGTLGHSYSKGNADAVSVISGSASVADAWATSLANLVKVPADIEEVLERAKGIKDILGCAVIIGERIGLMGEIEVKPLSSDP